MEIKKLTSDNHYKQTYVKINDSVYTLKNALHYFLEYREAILKQTEPLKQAPILDLSFHRLPSDSVILKKISEKRTQIFKTLNIAPHSKDPNDAKKLAMYLVNNISYYEPVKEEVVMNIHPSHQNKLEKSIQALENLQQKLSLIKEELLKNKNSKKLQNKQELFEIMLEKQFDKYHASFEEYSYKLIKAQNKYVLQSIYKTLIEKKGICQNYSYAYSYLLNETGIKSEVLHIEYDEKNQKSFHAMNALKVSKNEYYLCDVTELYYKHQEQIKHNLYDKQQFMNDMFFKKDYYENAYPNVKIRYYEHINEKNNFTSNMTLNKEHIKQLEKQIAPAIEPIK